MYTEMHRPGDAAAAADTAAKPVLGDIIEHVYEDDTHNNNNNKNNNNSNDEAATTATTTSSNTSAQGSAAADAAATTTLAEPHVVHVTERLATRLRPIQAVVGQAFPPVRPHTSYRLPPPTTSSNSNAQTAGRSHAAMQRTERTLPAGDATRSTAAMSAAVPLQRHHHQQYTDAAAVRDSHTLPTAAALATSSSSRRVQGGMQYSAHVQPDMPSLEESADRATTLRFSRPSFAAALPTSHTTTTTATRTTTTTKSDDAVQPSAVHNASDSNNSNSSTTATTYEMPELLGRLPVGGISMRNTATTSSSAAGDASAAAAESVAVPHQWSPADFVHMYRGYYAVPMTEGGEEDVLAAAQQEKEGEEIYGYGLPHALQDWSHNNNNSTTIASERTTTTSAHDANSVPTGEAYLRLLRCGLCSTVPRHQVIAMHALLLHLRYEGAVLRARCLHGGGAGGGDRHEGVDWLQGLLTRMTQATQVLPCKLAARCLLALLSPTTNNNNNKSSTLMSAAAAAAANAMQPGEVLVQALREVAFPLTDATTAHKARRGEHSEEQGEDDEGDETRAGPQLPRTMDEVEHLLGSGDEADIALAAEALGLTEKLLLAMPLLLHTIPPPPQQQQQHEEEESEEEGDDEMRAVDAGRHTTATASIISTQGDDGHNNRASGTSKRPARNTSSSSSNRRAHAAETLFLRLLRCGGVGLSEQTSCMRVARDVPFVLWAEQQLSDVVLGERSLASVLPLLCVLHDLAHCPAALTVLLTTMSSSSSISSSSSAYTSKLLTNNNNNNTRIAVAGRGSSNSNDASARPHAAAHETWLLFALYVCSMDVTRKAHTRRTHTGHGGDAVHTCNTNDNTDKEEMEDDDEEEEEMAAAVTMSLLLLRELIRHGVGLTLFLRDACGTILETGMTMGAAMLLEMWLVLLDQQQEEQQEHKKDEEGNKEHNKERSTCAAHVHERPEQAIFDEAARIAWHLYHHSLTSHTEGITAAAAATAATLAATATERNNDTREEEEEVRAEVQGIHEADITIITTHAEDSTGTHHTLPAHTLHEEHKARAERPARHLPSLQEEVAAVSNAHFLATYLTSRAVAVGSTHGKAHHTNKTKEGDEEEEGGREVKEEAGNEDVTTTAAAASSSASLLSFFGSAAETRRQVLALLTDLVACEDTAVVWCESLQPGAAGRSPALSAATPTPTTTAASSCDTHTQTSPSSSSLAHQQQQQQQADMPCSEVAGHTQAIEQQPQQPQQCDGVRVACTAARRYANARLACAIHTGWTSSSFSSSDVLLPEASPLLHRYGTRVLAAFVHRCLYTHTAPSSSSSSSLAVMRTLRRLQPEDLSTVLELMDLVQRTAQHTSPSSTLLQRGTTATEASREATTHNEEEQEGEAYDGQRLVCMAALLVLQGMCVTGHCLDGAPRALRCLLQCDIKVDAKAKKATAAAAADKSSSIITPTGTVSTAGTPLTASSSHHSPPPSSLSSPPVVHAAWSARQAALAACLCAGLERAAGLRVAFADPTADYMSSNNTEGKGTGGGDEDDEARTTLIGGGAEGRPWLLYPLYYTNNNNNNNNGSSSVDEADTHDKKSNDKEDEGERKEEHNSNNDITRGNDVAEMRVDKAVWAHWVMGLTRLQPRLTREVLQCDVVLSHALLWTLAHRARLFAAEATPKTPPPTTTATANTAACTTASTSDDEDDEACDMTAAEVHALCELLAELALLLVPAEVGSSSGAHWDSTKKKENRDDAGGEKTGTTSTSASTTVQSAVSVPPAAAAQPPRACVRRQEDEHEHEHEHEHDEQTTKESEVHAPLTSPSHDAAHARLSAPPCRFSHAASATLGIPLQAYANPQSEAAMPAIVHCVLGLVAAHAQPATSLAALQLLLSTPVCPTTNTRATAAGTMCGNGGCSDDATVKSAHSHAGRRHMQRGQKDDDEHNDDEAGVGECVATPQQEGDDATVADDRMSRLRAALTWWSAAVQPGSHASHSVPDNDATDVGVMHDAVCTAAASAKGGGLVQAAASSHHDTITTTAAARTSCEVVRWSLTQLVALLQLVGPHLSSRAHEYSPTPRMVHTHHHHPHDDDDAEGDGDDDEVMSDAAAEDAEDEEMRAAHDIHTTTNNSNNDEEEDVRRWCVETVTDGLLRRYLYSHTKTGTSAATAADTRTSQAATTTSTSAANAETVQLSAMEQTVLRETLRQLHWRPAVLWPYVV